jgi:phospholipid transport system substrate-binding protein
MNSDHACPAARRRRPSSGGLRLAAALWLGALACAGASQPARAADEPNAQQVIQQASTRAITVLKQRKKELQDNPQKIYQFVEEYLLPHFDFEFVCRQVLGKNWRTASEEERARFRQAFQETLIRSYGSSMLQYSDQKIEFLPFKEEPGAREAVVRTEIETTSGKPAAVDYTMRKSDGTWKVVDVTIEGVSMVVNYRSTFTQEIRRLNGLEPLIAKLEERNRMGITNEPGEPNRVQ